MRVSSDSSFSLVWRPFFCGRKPSKQNRSQGRPEDTMAGMQAVAPGSVCISMPSSLHVRTSRNPGSEIPGVPASLMSATLSPARIFSFMIPAVWCSLNLWWDWSLPSIP